MLILDKPLVIVDLETTEDESGNHHIIEIGAVKVDTTLEIQDQFSTFVYPPVPIAEHMTKIHGITPDMVMKAPKWESVGDRFAEFCGFKYHRLGAWGAHFDVNVLRYEYGKANREYPLLGVPLCLKSIVMVWCMHQGHRFPKGWSLKAVCDRLDVIGPERNHRALDDATATLRLLTYISEKMS